MKAALNRRHEPSPWLRGQLADLGARLTSGQYGTCPHLRPGDVEEQESEHAGKPATIWYYTLAAGITPTALDPDSVPDMALPTQPSIREGQKRGSLRVPPAISGTECTVCGGGLDPWLTDQGATAHVGCGATS